MIIKIDENLPDELADDIRALGHQADTVHQEGLTGASDPVILERTRSEGRVLLTMDKGIADIRAYPPSQHAGIVLFRLRASGRKYVSDFVRRQLPALLGQDLSGRLVVISESGFRSR